MTRWATAAFLLCAPVTAAAQNTANTQGEFELTPTGYVQLDFRSFPDWPVSPGTGRLERDTIELRRIRAGLDGSWRRWSFQLSVDPMDEDGTLVKDAYAQMRVGAYRIRAGQFKPPGSREYGTAARNTDFLERAALASSLAAQRDIGAMILGDIGSHFDYQAGVFAGDDNGANDRSGLTAAGRFEWEPSNALILAAFVSEGALSATDTEPENGLDGRMPSGYRFFEDVYVQGRRRRIGGDVEWSPGSWQFTAEALRVRDERREQGVEFNDLPPLVGIGGSVTARWRFAPRREVAARYEYLGFDDVGPDVVTGSVRPRASNLRARAGHAFTVGGGWRLRPWLRLMGNAGLEWFSEARSAPDPARTMNPVLAMRLQFELP